MNKKYIITIFCILALIISSTSAYSIWLTQDKKNISSNEKVMTKMNDIILPIINNGVFTAKLGIEKNEEGLYYLTGNYQVKDNIISCDGSANSADQEGEFSCIFKDKYYFEIKITLEDKPIIISGKYKFDKNKEDFQGLWGKEGKDECFKFVYPITYIMPDGTYIIVENEEGWDEIKDWYKTNPEVKEKPVLHYPIDIIFEDGTIKTINNEAELKGAYEYCEDKEIGWITGTFQGLENDKEAKLLARDGAFNAELVIRGNERVIELDGNYHSRGRIILIRGSDDYRFSGLFRGNMFMIRTQINGRAQTIIGRYRLADDNSFTGSWSCRGLQNRGSITGVFN
jgi:hypothetical protein